MKKNIYITDHFSVQQKLTHYKSTIPQERNNERRKEKERKKERRGDTSGGGGISKTATQGLLMVMGMFCILTVWMLIP